jgi:PAS domain S-box-containing protein
MKKTETDALEYADSIINTIREPLIALDQDLKVITANRSFYKVFKVKPEETIGKLIYNLGNNQWDIPRLRELLETIIPQKTTLVDFEVEHDFSTIGKRILLLNAQQMEKVLGKKKIILLAIEDITERLQAEEKLFKINKKFKDLISRLNEIVWTASADGSQLIDLNENFKKVYGISAAQFRSDPQLWIKMVHPEDRKIAEASGEKLFKTGRAQAEYRIIRPDGTVRWLVDRKSILYDKDGNPIQMGGIATDITKHKRTEEKIREQNNDLVLVNSINQAVNDGKSLKTILRLAAKGTERIFNSSGVTLHLLSSDQQRLVMQNHNLPPRVVEKIEMLIGAPLPRIEHDLQAPHPYRQVLESGTFQLINNIKDIQEFTAAYLFSTHLTDKMRSRIKRLIPVIIKLLGYQSIIVIPLISDGRIIGTLDMGRRELFTKSDARRLKTFSKRLTSIIIQKQTEEALRQNEILLLKTSRMAKIGGWELDLKTNNLTWTLETYHIHEVDPLVKPDLEKAISFYAPESRPIMTEAVQQSIKEGKPFNLELPLITAKGNQIWVHTLGQIESRKGKNKRLFGTIQDITERKRAEHLLNSLNQASTSMGTAQTHKEIFNTVAKELKQLDISCMLFPLDETRSKLVIEYMSYESSVLDTIGKLTGFTQKDFSFPVDAVDVYREVIREKKALFSDNSEQVIKQVLPKFAKKFSAIIVKTLNVQRSIYAPLIIEVRSSACSQCSQTY